MSTPEQNQQTDELISGLRRTANFAPATTRPVDRLLPKTRDLLHDASENLATLTAENARLREALEGNKVDIFDLLGAMNAGESLPKILVRVNDIYTRADVALTPQEGHSDD